MNLSVISGNANPALAEAVARILGTKLIARTLQRFPDSELHIEIQESVRTADVYIIQPTSPPVDSHLMELLMLADACRRAGAARITAVVPYIGYARQDRRSSGREPVGARLVADLVAAAHIDRIVAMDTHTTGLEGVFPVPLEHLSAVDTLAAALATRMPSNGVVMSPDLGGVKLAERYSRKLKLPLAIVHKTRLSGLNVKAVSIVGDVKGRTPIVVDDMISTGGTIEAALHAASEAGAARGPMVAATHAVLVGPAVERLKPLGLTRLVVSDSVALSTGADVLPIEVASIAPVLAEAISRLNQGKSLGDLLVRA
ncbi:MAG: ribose-phosphate diphosphokinase [Candidatus Binataceae bacterium]